MLLSKANNGISINIITFRTPTHCSRTNARAQDLVKVVNLNAFYQDSTKAIRNRTQLQNNKKLFQYVYSNSWRKQVFAKIKIYWITKYRRLFLYYDIMWIFDCLSFRYSLCLQNIRFFRQGRELKKSDPSLASVEYVSIIFKDQKNGHKMDTITIYCVFDLVLCRVRACSKILWRIFKYRGTNSGTNSDTPLHTF